MHRNSKSKFEIRNSKSSFMKFELRIILKLFLNFSGSGFEYYNKLSSHKKRMYELCSQIYTVDNIHLSG